MKILTCGYACALACGLLLILLPLGCGGGGGGGDGRRSETPVAAEEARQIAYDLIVRDYPEFERMDPLYQGYESAGRQVHEFTYMRTIEVAGDGDGIEIPHNIVVSVDEASGEAEVFESD